MKRHLSKIVFALGIGFTLACLYNVFSDPSEVQRQASVVACGDLGPSCDARMTRFERTPFSHTYEMNTPARKVEVRCKRSLYLVGSYSCALN